MQPLQWQLSAVRGEEGGTEERYIYIIRNIDPNDTHIHPFTHSPIHPFQPAHHKGNCFRTRRLLRVADYPFLPSPSPFPALSSETMEIAAITVGGGKSVLLGSEMGREEKEEGNTKEGREDEKRFR